MFGPNGATVRGSCATCATPPPGCSVRSAPHLPRICPARGVGAALVLPGVNIAAMNLHLAEISSQVAPGAHAVITLDGAGWQQPGGGLVVPDNISLLALPPYSPELNPVENIWQYLRQNYLANRVFETCDAILDACCDAWNALVEMPETIRSIATREWAKKVKI